MVSEIVCISGYCVIDLFFVQAEDGIRDLVRSRGLGDVYKRQTEMDIVIQIQSVSGKLVKTISKTIQASGYRIDGIQWDGKDDFGNDLANGVYLYRLSMNAKTGNEVIHKPVSYTHLTLPTSDLV